jgi:hypothetical protein
MNSRIKQYILIAVLAAVGYFVLNNHFIFYGTDVHLLKKDSLHLHYTFYSIKAKNPKTIMKIDYLREAGIGDLLVELGMINEEQKTKLESEYSYD